MCEKPKKLTIVCPISFGAGAEKMVECEKNVCPWWCNDSEQCVIKDIADSIKSIAKYLGRRTL